MTKQEAIAEANVRRANGETVKVYKIDRMVVQSNRRGVQQVANYINYEVRAA